MPRRLPIAGAAPAGSAPVELGERPACEERVVAVVPAQPEIDVSPFVEALALDARVEVGEALPARCRPWLLVLVTGGHPEPTWTPVARALRSEADLILADPRPATARSLQSRPGPKDRVPQRGRGPEAGGGQGRGAAL